jgi:DNA-binding response OmpR family regulator
MQTILIIDDDAAIGNLEQEVLERAGYAVLRAYSGTEALLLLKDSRPDLVLLDLMLPGLSGEEVLPQLQGISVIVVSAKTAVQDKVGLLLAKSVLLDRIGADTPDCTEGSLKTHISNLRGKLRDATGKDHIEAVWGIGFRLRPES